MSRKSKGRITARDLKLMQHIAENGFSSARWIRERFWGGKANCNYYRRLSVLRAMGLVEHLIGDSGNKLAYRLTKHGSNFLRTKGLECVEGAASRAIYRTNYDHDDYLVGLGTFLRALPAVSEFCTEGQVRRLLAATHGHEESQGSGYKVPDGLFLFRTKQGTFRVALELELAQKALGYRRKIVKKLVVSTDFDLVFMIVADSKMMQRFKDTLAWVRANDRSVGVAARDVGFYFALLPDVLANKANAKFEGEGSSFTLNQFAA